MIAVKLKPHFFMILVLLLSYSIFAYDYGSNMEEMSHIGPESLNKGRYIDSWYDSVSSNYFALMTLYGEKIGEDWINGGVVIIKTTDPSNPVIIDTIVMKNPQDVKVIGNYAYASDWGWGTPRPPQLYIIPLQSDSPYYDINGIDSIAYDDNADTQPGSTCDTIPMYGNHTMFARDGYLYLTENGEEFAILDVSSTPTAPILAGHISGDTIWSDDIKQVTHSIAALGDTIYGSQNGKGIFRIVIDPNNDFEIVDWGRLAYDSWRRDVRNDNPTFGLYTDSFEVIVLDTVPDSTHALFCPEPPCTIWEHYWGPASHSNYPVPGGYLLSCDENDFDFRRSNCRDTLAAILRIFNVAEFDTVLDTVEVADAFEVIWQDSPPYINVCTDIDSMDFGNWPVYTPCPENLNCIDSAHAYAHLGIHDVTVVGRLAFAAYHGLGTHIIDVSDPENLKYQGGIAHDLASNDPFNKDAYAICIAKNGYVYQSGEDAGFYIYRHGYSGMLTSNAEWSGDVYVYDTFILASGAKLTITPGTRVYMYEDALIQVNSGCTLSVQGNYSEPVLFAATTDLYDYSEKGYWSWIKFSANSVGDMTYCTIKDGYYGIEMQDSSNVSLANCLIKDIETIGIYNYKGKLSVNNCTFEYIENYGVYAYKAESVIDSSSFKRCDDYGIFIDLAASAPLGSSIITNNHIRISDGSSVETGSQYGIRADGIDSIRIENNLVRTYEQGGIYLSASDAFIRADTVRSTEYYGIYPANLSDADIDSCVFDTLNTGMYITDDSRPVVRACQFRNTIGCKVFQSASPDLGRVLPGRINEPGKNDFEACSTYYIYQQREDPPFECVSACGNYFGPDGPDTSKFYGCVWYAFYDTLDPFPRARIETGVPLTYQLNANYPNPFNPNTTIKYSLAEPGYTTISIYNILGQRITTIVDEHKQAGHYAVTWDGKNRYGKPVSSGIYFYRIESGEFINSKKMLLLR